MKNIRGFFKFFYSSSVYLNFIVIAQMAMLSQVHAWGALGHQSVALIAEAYLKPEVRVKVDQLLKGQRLADIAMDADNLRDQPQYLPTKKYHFQNIESYYLDPYKKQIQLNRTEPQKYQLGAIEAILKAQEQIAAVDSSDEQRVWAVKMLTHFVGDLHQPLHTGLKSQYGGNGLILSWDGEKRNLHQLWDSEILVEDLQSKIPSSRAQSWRYARLAMSEQKGQNDEAIRDLNPENWFLESLTIQKQAIKTFAGKNQSAYQAWAAPLIEARIYLAGRRLAEVLNRSLASAPVEVSEFTKLRKWLERELGDWSRRLRWARVQIS